ncbi:MAG: TolC family protein [Planctomycetes bacterium]|nr:TolC family protein [Planctomycetota bacterium]
MQRRLGLILLYLLLPLVILGCDFHSPFSVTANKGGPDLIQEKVEEQLEQEQREQDSTERWDRYQQDDYQTDEIIDQHRDAPDATSRREQDARELLAKGPVTLDDCLAFSLAYNDSVQGRRAAIRAVKAEALLEYSRFLPQLYYYLEEEGIKETDSPRWTHAREHTLRLDQTLLEFGVENSSDASVRDAQASALFDYENTVADVLSNVRVKFFTVLMRKQQIEERKKLLVEFKARHEKIKELEEARRVLEVDVLTAKLNVLNEEQRINSLEGELLRQKIDLLHYTGLPLEALEMELAGEWSQFNLELEEIIRLALRRSTSIASARINVAEQLRATRQALWAYAPNLSLEVGHSRRGNEGGLTLTGEDGAFELSSFAERNIPSEPPGVEYEEDERYLNLSLELPLFDGLERNSNYKIEKEQLVEARFALRDTIDSVENNVRKLHQTLLESRKQLDIYDQTAKISWERLQVQEELKKLGKISDDQLETFRDRYFSDQDRYFSQQITVMRAQESLRSAMRYFEVSSLEIGKEAERSDHAE